MPDRDALSVAELDGEDEGVDVDVCVDEPEGVPDDVTDEVILTLPAWWGCCWWEGSQPVAYLNMVATVLAMLPDTGERYLSTALFADIPEGSDPEP